MKVFSRIVEAEAEQYTGSVTTFTLEELTPLPGIKHAASYYDPQYESNLTILPYDYLVKYSDGSLYVLSEREYNERFSSVNCLTEIINILTKELPSVSEAIEICKKETK